MIRQQIDQNLAIQTVVLKLSISINDFQNLQFVPQNIKFRLFYESL